MNAAQRRKEIISILASSGHITQRQLAWEFNVSIRTIQHDVVELSLEYPIYTKPGTAGGIFIMGGGLQALRQHPHADGAGFFMQALRKSGRERERNPVPHYP